MKPPTETDGFSIHRAVVAENHLIQLREEAERVAAEAGSSCVRHLRSRSEMFDTLVHSDSLTSLLPRGMIPVRSILFDKNEKENWSVAWHQDLTIALVSKVELDGYHPWSTKDGFPHVQPTRELLENMVTIRLHLDDTPATNGALRVIPKSHTLGKIPTHEIVKHTQNQETTCECSAGDALLMKPLILHSSRRSEPPAGEGNLQRRRVIHIEYARDGDLDSNLQWAEQLTFKKG